MLHSMFWGSLIGGLTISACTPVPQSRRQYLADPTMQLGGNPLEARALRKYRGTREGANGGDGKAAGGGCGCAN